MNLEELKRIASKAVADHHEAQMKLQRTIREEVEAARVKIESAHDKEALEVSKLYYKKLEAEKAVAEAEAEEGARSYIKLRNGITLHPGDAIKIERRKAGRSRMIRAYVEVRGPETRFSYRSADWRRPRMGHLFARLRLKDGSAGAGYLPINEHEDWRHDK